MDTQLQADLIQKTCELVRFASSADNLEQIGACMAWIRSYLERLPDIHIVYQVWEGYPVLVATLHATRTPAIFLNGHIDVVPGREEQFVPQVRHGRIYGRGAQDMKGSVAVLLRLFHDLAHHTPRPNIGIQIVSDEETGGQHGTKRLVEDGWKCEWFLAAEPTNFGICYEQKGSIWMRLRIPGVSGHGSRPWEAQNPIIKLTDGLQTLFQHFPIPRADEWRTSVTPTVLGTPNATRNRTPDELFLTLDIRYVPEEHPQEVAEQVRACFPDAEVVECDIHAPLITDPHALGIRRLAEAVKRVRGHEAICYRESYGSDARFYSQGGIPAICFGPIGAGLHSHDEWVDVASLVDLYHILWHFAHDWRSEVSE